MAVEPHSRALRRRLGGALAAGTLALALVACFAQTRHERPAVLVDPTAETRAELHAVVTDALGAPRLLLADDALTRSSVLTVEPAGARGLPPDPATGRMLGSPERFDLVIEDSRCVLLHAGDRYELRSARCAPIAGEPH